MDENSAVFSQKPEECKHKNPRRWGGQPGTFLLCDHCGKCWQRTSAEEPETWAETGVRKKPGDRIPKLGKPKFKGRARRQREAPGEVPVPSAAPSTTNQESRPNLPPTPPPPQLPGVSSASSSRRPRSWQELAVEEFELTDLEDYTMASAVGSEI